MINDISGGLFDSAMLRTAAELGCPIVLMHTRGSAKEMVSLAKYGDGPDTGNGRGVLCMESYSRGAALSARVRCLDYCVGYRW